MSISGYAYTDDGYKLANFTSTGNAFATQPINIRHADIVSFQISFDGTPSGTIDLQVSNYQERDKLGTTSGGDPAPSTWVWTSKTGTDLPVNTATAASPVFIDYVLGGPRWIRLVYAGSANITVNSITYQLKDPGL